jgi:2-polyprenyl-3-methyl-5-hydroxy-6-metoxy-1,4-benzoquinol methylase
MKALTDVRYWEEHWWSTQRPQRLRWPYRDQDYETIQLIRQAASDKAARIIELGAGGSRILPYLGRKLGNPVFGADFSPMGCKLLRANLRLQGIQGSVICEDLFRSSIAAESFDVVYSSGVIEHFEDLRAVVAAHLRLVKPGGRMVLIVPNLKGVQGKIYRRLAPPLWAKHVVFGPNDLAGIFRSLDLSEIRSGYLGSFFLHVGRDAEWPGVKAHPQWQQSLVYWSVRLGNAAVSLLCRLLPWRPHTRALSPAFFATGLKSKR